MRMVRGAATAVLAGALVVGTTAAASPDPVPGGAVRWSPAHTGEATGVELTGGTVRLAPAKGSTTNVDCAGDRLQSRLSRPGRSMIVTWTPIRGRSTVSQLRSRARWSNWTGPSSGWRASRPYLNPRT